MILDTVDSIRNSCDTCTQVKMSRQDSKVGQEVHYLGGGFGGILASVLLHCMHHMYHMHSMHNISTLLYPVSLLIGY